jgi:3-demethoxyubiquinol 3-hydroxylase
MKTEPSDPRFQTPLDRVLAEFEQALRTAWAVAPLAHRPSPAPVVETESMLAESERALSEGLMRVNHTGEIAAQALYRGQALVARNLEQRRHLLRAAEEEQDHLAWCQQRLGELNGHRSYLAPFWYAGSFFIGTLAEIAGVWVSSRRPKNRFPSTWIITLDNCPNRTTRAGLC